MDCLLCSKHGIEIIMKTQENFKFFFFLSRSNTLAIFILTQLGTKPLTSKAKLNSVEKSFVLCCVWGVNIKLSNLSLGLNCKP